LLHEQRQQIEELNEVSGRYAWNGARFVMADIITICLDVHNSDMIINRGKKDGLTAGQYVLGDYSIIGKIAALDERTAQVRLITDPASKLAVNIGQADINAILQGVGNGQARISLLPTKYSVKAGDIVYAKKKAGFLDASIITGYIADCQRSHLNPMVWDVDVLPACNVKSLENVTVVVMTEQQNLETDQSARVDIVKEQQELKK
jgi:rod shape-determining protein MreC